MIIINNFMRISIITVTFNRAHIIHDCIEGVLKQNFKDYEYIIVDGASKDNTVDILKEYEPKFEGRMRWISEPDKGLYDAINKGIRMAKGDIVGIINSDDFFPYNDTFTHVAKAFEDGTVEAVYGDSINVFDTEMRTIYHTSLGPSFRIWMYRIGMMPSHQTFYAKRDLFDKLGYYKIDYKITADYELMLRFIYVNRIKVKYVNHPLIAFRFGGVSTQMSNKGLLNKECIRACKENGLYCCSPLIWLKYIVRFKDIVGLMLWQKKNKR